ncbi:hypothetical protein JY68_01660 [Neisseria meningitidis]|jgi:hypothetical protein|uniref:PilS cassette n=1 Tax=Neisseria meningitidis serogroup B TaxID=491 RepID=A0A0H5QC97_NEIMI|nr:hypothetical protein JY17_00270 [Neisseria meningitidis]RPC40479.1 hypothetical protein JY47_09620 [Neisseria meningitidis]RPC87932.1 hypothetical protein JY68_01660 [Neisseria meningitidis]CRY99101.1 hypothetical protein [Neisseria meningitidis serogroup B]
MNSEKLCHGLFPYRHVFRIVRPKFKIPSFPQKQKIPSFPRRRESGSFGFGHFQQIPVALRCWFPAFVEMAAEGFCFPTNIYVYRMKFHRPHKNAR